MPCICRAERKRLSQLARCMGPLGPSWGTNLSKLFRILNKDSWFFSIFVSSRLESDRAAFADIAVVDKVSPGGLGTLAGAGRLGGGIGKKSILSLTNIIESNMGTNERVIGAGKIVAIREMDSNKNRSDSFCICILASYAERE